MKEMIPESEDFWKQSIDDGVLGIVGTTEGRGQRLCCVGNCDNDDNMVVQCFQICSYQNLEP